MIPTRVLLTWRVSGYMPSTGHRAARTYRSAAENCRIVSIIRPTAVSATQSVNTSGVSLTATPRAAAAFTSVVALIAATGLASESHPGVSLIRDYNLFS